MATSSVPGAMPGVVGSTEPRVDNGSTRIYSVVEMQSDPEFQELKRRFRAFAFPTTILFLGWYLLYVIASGFARDFMAQKVVGNINVAIIFGLLQFVSTFLIAFLYSWYANTRLDPLAEKLRKRIAEEQK
jgi:uncharacterized membrane protein (DUF485 family)